jgi:Zn-dependent protease
MIDGQDFSSRIYQLVLIFIPFTMAVIFHEFAHGFMAKKYGDTTAEDNGRLTLNPLPHVDPVGTIMLPIFFTLSGVPAWFGWAKPVPINPTRFSNYRRGLFWVSFAGPLMNILLATLFAAAFTAFLRFAPQDTATLGASGGLLNPLMEILKVAVYINFSLAFFNMIPIPPLDGSKMLESFLSYNATRKMEEVGRFGFWIILALMFTGFFKIISVPVIYSAQFVMILTDRFWSLFG